MRAISSSISNGFVRIRPLHQARTLENTSFRCEHQIDCSLCGFLPAFQSHPYQASSHPAPQADTLVFKFCKPSFRYYKKISLCFLGLYAMLLIKAHSSIIIYNQDFIHGATFPLFCPSVNRLFLAPFGSATPLHLYSAGDMPSAIVIYSLRGVTPSFSAPFLVSYVIHYAPSTERHYRLCLEQYKFICSNASVSLLAVSGVFCVQIATSLPFASLIPTLID